jgi:mono/diheme cytochrome c family protein
MRQIIATLILLGAPVAALAAGDAAAGKTLFAQKCKACHGPEGKGGTAVLKAAGAEKTDLTSKEVLAKSDEELKKLSLGGYKKKKPVKTVDDKQLTDIIAFMRTMK